MEQKCERPAGVEKMARKAIELKKGGKAREIWKTAKKQLEFQKPKLKKTVNVHKIRERL